MDTGVTAFVPFWNILLAGGVQMTCMQRLFWLGMALFGVGLVLALTPSQDADLYFQPVIRESAYPKQHPLVLIDEAHNNTHKRDGRLLPFSRLIAQDGYRPWPNLQKFSAASLEGVKLLVIANALGWGGLLQHAANLAGLEGSLTLPVNAFAGSEIDALGNWVKEGGGLLLTADHAPCGRAARPLAAAFGIEMADGYVEDPVFHDPQSNAPSFLLFSESNGLLKPHPVTTGRGPQEQVHRVVTFTGQAVRGGEAFLQLSPQARQYPRRQASEREAQTVEGWAQGVALRYGQGRVVILGETAMITSQIATAGPRRLHIGISGDNNNQQLVLNIMHWLSGLTP